MGSMKAFLKVKFHSEKGDPFMGLSEAGAPFSACPRFKCGKRLRSAA
jgi:hypothetical protein